MTTFNENNNLVADSSESYYFNLTGGTALVKTGNGSIMGITVNQNSSGVLNIFDGTTFDDVLIMHSSISFGSPATELNLRGERFAKGLLLNLTGEGCDITIQYR